MTTQSENTEYTWNDDSSSFDSQSDLWSDSNFASYVKISDSTLRSAGEYVILAQNDPYEYVENFTQILETISDTGTGTILKKEFRYSIDFNAFSEFEELNLSNLNSHVPITKVWFQFRYILLSGGPVTITKVSLKFNSSIKTGDKFDNYEHPDITNQDKIYAFPITFRSNFTWEPYKMNRAIRLYKDLNLMVNNTFGHEVNYYRVLPQGRSKDVVLMEYSLYEHDEGICMKVIVPNNEFPDNKLNMGPFGVDFELPFEVQVDKDYYQKIFGEGSGPQKRDVIFIPRTNRIYEISSSYLYRDFMNEPLYFKISLIKWLPKTNVEQSDTVSNLQDLTVSAASLFGEEITEQQEENAKLDQYTVPSRKYDPVRSYLNDNQIIESEKLLNYHTLIAEHSYDMSSLLNFKEVKVLLEDSSLLTLKDTYYVRFDQDIEQDDEQMYYSMKKLKYIGDNDEGFSVFTWLPGYSNFEANYNVNLLFKPDSEFFLYDAEYNGEPNDAVLSCDSENYLIRSRKAVVVYNATNSFLETEDRSFSSWFKIQNNDSKQGSVTSFSYDEGSCIIDITYDRSIHFMYDETVSLKRTATSNFVLFGNITEIVSSTRIKMEVDRSIMNFVKSGFSNWETFTDLKIRSNCSNVFLDGYLNGTGIKIELFEKRHFMIMSNSDKYFFSISNNLPELLEDKWYGLFINISNIFKQLTVNVWEIQWNSTTNLPSTTDLKLVFNKTVTIKKEDRSSSSKFILKPSNMNFTNIRLFSKVAETDKQTMLLNQNIVKDAHLGIIVDNALTLNKRPFFGDTK